MSNTLYRRSGGFNPLAPICGSTARRNKLLTVETPQVRSTVQSDGTAAGFVQCVAIACTVAIGSVVGTGKALDAATTRALTTSLGTVSAFGAARIQLGSPIPLLVTPGSVLAYGSRRVQPPGVAVSVVCVDSVRGGIGVGNLSVAVSVICVDSVRSAVSVENFVTASVQCSDSIRVSTRAIGEL